MDNFIRAKCLGPITHLRNDLPSELARLSVPADWPVDKLSGLEKWRDMRAFKTESMRAGVHEWVISTPPFGVFVGARVASGCQVLDNLSFQRDSNVNEEEDFLKYCMWQARLVFVINVCTRN